MDEQTEAKSELDTLKQRADLMGIPYHHRAGVAKLRELIAEHLLNPGKAKETQTEELSEEESTDSPKQYKATTEKLYLTEEEFRMSAQADERKNANRLVRIRLTCMNPLKKAWPGEIISVGSARMGTFKKYIPFRAEEPYHVPLVIYEELKTRKCRVGITVDGPNGQKVNRYKLINEFAVELLPPLSSEELRRLAQRQAMKANEDAMVE